MYSMDVERKSTLSRRGNRNSESGSGKMNPRNVREKMSWGFDGEHWASEAGKNKREHEIISSIDAHTRAK